MLEIADQRTSRLVTATILVASVGLFAIAGPCYARILNGFLTESAFAAKATVAMEDHEKDSDKDGLTDFQETHKYMTNPQKADSDDDGIPDGNWLERREYQYTVRNQCRH